MVNDVLAGLIVLVYYVGFAMLIALLNATTSLPKEFIRKSYHIACSLSIFLLLKLFDRWYMAVVASLVPFALGGLVLFFGRGAKVLDRFRIDRDGQGNELLRQVASVQVSFAVLLTVFWGLLGPGYRYHAAVGIMAWGFGDAFAALIGKRFGRHRITLRIADGKKTVEGTIAAVAVTFLVVCKTLLWLGGVSIWVCVPAALILALVGGAVELVCRHGIDNVALPLTVATFSVPVVKLLSLAVVAVRR